MIFRILLVATLVTVNPLSSMAQGGDQTFDPLRLNIRLSPTALHPPSHLIKQQWMLDGYRLGRLGPQAPQAVIIEDDARRRLLILSATEEGRVLVYQLGDRKSTRLNSSHLVISYAVFCLKKKKKK